jgi:hypothetical protein
MNKTLYLLIMLALPRVYMLDWTTTPTEIMDNYITTSMDFVMTTGEGHIVFIADLVGTCADGDGHEEAE